MTPLSPPPSQEYQDGNPNLTISDTSPKQAVYVFRCTKSTLRVTGKVNNIILGTYVSYIVVLLSGCGSSHD